MQLVLIAPPSPFEETPEMDIPLGLAYISAYLKSKGLDDITLVDFNLLKYDYYHDKGYLKEIPLGADIYGITVTTPQFFWYCEIVEYIKAASDALVVSGGPHPTVRPSECFERTKTDFVARGAVVQIDSLPSPDRTLINPFRYKRTLGGKRAFHVVSASGCPYNCSFCSKKSIEGRTRFRSVPHFLAELDTYTREYGITRFVIYDDTFTVDRERAIRIAREMGERSFIWRCFSRTDRVDYEVLKTFKGNGLSSITFGIETFADKMLQVYNKGTTAEDNRKALSLCKELGIPVRCSLIYGGPFETRETLEETIQGVRETQPDEWNISTFSPIPGSDIGDNPDKYHIEIYPDPFYLKYHRVGESGMGEPQVRISTMTPDEYKENRQWFVEKLEEVCPRRQIQDTIQTLDTQL